MTTQLSHIHSVLTMNGEQVQGLSGDDVPIDLPQMGLAMTRRGMDGTLYALGTGTVGGEVRISLLPTSTTAKAWMIIVRGIQNGDIVDWNGEWRNTETTYNIQLRGGVLLEAPPGVHPGKNCEFRFDFEQIFPQFDGARFNSSPFTRFN